MTCQELADFLSDYLAEELSPEVRAVFDAHLRICPDCVRYLDSFRKTMQLVRQASARPVDESAIVPPDALVKAILASRRR